MKTTKRIIALLMILTPLLCIAQTYSGMVVDEGGNALQGVSVVLKNDKGSSVVFTATDSNGHFTLTLPGDKEASSMQFSRMGYARNIVMLSDFAEGETIVLQEKTLVLDEVKVKSQRLRLHGDTIDYLVSRYKEKEDRSIADVIARMAGMTVKQDGTIMYQGKPINKFYVEGMDLLGGKYAIASENISADKVKKVQVYEKHQPVKSLKDISFSEQAAINIVLADDAKDVLQGAVEAGAGHTMKGEDGVLREAKLMAMLFSRKKQSLTMYKSANTGKSPENELTSKSMFDGYVPTESSMLQDASVGGAGLDEERTKFNDAHIIASNWLFTPSKDHELRLQLTGMYDRIRQQQTRKTIYTNIEGMPILTEESNARQYKTEYGGEVNYTVNNEKLYLYNRLEAYADFNRSTGNIMLNGNSHHESVKPRKRYITDFLRFNRRLNSGKFVSGTAYISYNYLPGLILLANNTYERLNMHSTTWNASTGYRHRLLGLNFDYKAGIELLSQRLTTDNYISNTKDRYSSLRMFLYPAVEYKHGSITATVSAEINALHRTLNNRKKNELTAEPHFSLHYKPTTKWNFSLYYRYYHTPMELTTINSTPIFYSYNGMNKGTGNLEHTASHNGSSSAEFKNTLKELFANITLSYTNRRNNIMYEYRIEPDYLFYISTPTDFRTNSANYSLHGNISKGFSWARMNVTLTGGHSWNNYKMLIANDIVSAQGRSANINLNIYIKPLKWLSISEKTSLNISQQKYKNYGGMAGIKLRNLQQNLRINLYAGKWTLSWVNDIYHCNDKTMDTSYFSDIWIAYRKKTFDISLQLNNIFGMHQFERRIFTDTEQIVTSIRLRERSFFAKLSVNL